MADTQRQMARHRRPFGIGLPCLSPPFPFPWNLTLPQEKNHESRDSCHAAHLMATMVAPQASVPNASIDTAHEDMIVSVPDAYALRGCLMLSCQRSTPATSCDVRAKQKRARTAGCCPWLRQHHSVGPTIWRKRSKFSVCDGRASPMGGLRPSTPLWICVPPVVLRGICTRLMPY